MILNSLQKNLRKKVLYCLSSYLKFLILITICVLSLSCVSLFDKSATILAKSKQETPDWAKPDWHNTSINSKYKNIVLKKDDVYDLNLGIKQIQSVALFRYKPALPKEIYWEYRQKDTNNGPERFYTVWLLLSVLQ